MPEAQRLIINDPSRFQVASIGRQWGKTTTMLARIGARACMDRGQYWWVAPTYPQARVAYNRFLRAFAPAVSKVNKSYQEVEVRGGAVISFKGSDSPDNLRGETLKGAVLDECGMMRSNIWPEIIQPMLRVHKGWATLGGTPKGPNWFRDVYFRAPDDPDWSRFHYPSNQSPFFSDDEFEKARASTSERIFRQEYLAEFLADDNDVFRGINDCIAGQLHGAQSGVSYVLGVDVAKHADWTVIVVLDIVHNKVVHFERFQKIDWPFQIERIAAASTAYNRGMVFLDATGVGDPIFDALTQKGAPVVPVKFTNAVKSDLVQKLSLAIEQRAVTFPDIPELLGELRAFSFERLPSGLTRYSAPDGLHDDCVMALALAVMGMGHGSAIASFGPMQTR